MHEIFLSGTGVHLPDAVLTSEELAEHYNQFIVSNSLPKRGSLKSSSADFMVEASGIKERRVIEKSGILSKMRPSLPYRRDEELSLQCELALPAARQAMEDAGKKPADIDAVIVATTYLQRPFPSIAIELQSALGIDKGFAFDLSAACSSASFGISAAYSYICSDLASCVLVVSPEIYSCGLNYLDRTSHFIFGDGCSAAIIEKGTLCQKKDAYKILDISLKSQFSNNIRNNFGFMNRFMDGADAQKEEQFFKQNGKKVREEIVPFASEHILWHLQEKGIDRTKVKRLWLHQANAHIIHQIAASILQREPATGELPNVLPEYGNTGSAGVLIAFHENHRDLNSQEIGVLCSFGAGYAIGSVLLEKR